MVVSRGVVVRTVPPTCATPSVAETAYPLAGLLPSVSVVDARPLLSVVALVVLNDADPSSGFRLNVTVRPDTLFPSSVASTVNVTDSPGSRVPNRLIYNASGGPLTKAIGGGGGGGGGVLTDAVTLTDALPADAVTVYEPGGFLS